MTRVMFMSTVALAALAQAAFAADLPRRPTQMPEPPIKSEAPPLFTWTGVYLGATVGGAFAGGHGFTDVNGYNAAGSVDRVGGRSSVVGGVTAGYNYQFGSIVAGVEGDVNFLNARGSAPAAASPGLDTRYAVRNGVLGTARARLGYAFDRFLVYGTGGLAFTDTRFSVNDICTVAPCGASTIAGKGGVNATWTLGAGVEYAINRHWSAKVEYLFIAEPGRNFSGVTNTGAVDNFRVNNSGVSIGSVGVNYRF